MRSNNNKDYIQAGVIAAVFVILSFLLPFHHGGVFWVSLIFGLASVGLQFPLFMLGNPKADAYESQMLELPIRTVGIAYIVVQMIVSLLLYCIGTSWETFSVIISVLFCLIIVGGAYACGLSQKIGNKKTSASRTSSSRPTDSNTVFMDSLKLSSQQLINKTPDANLREQLTNLADAIKFSDPISNSKTTDADNRLYDIFRQLERAVENGANDVAEALVKNVMTALNERNNACKMYNK